ncbi:MAG: hemerythrin domain-containing protein [Acidobacteriota bacterium]|nr:hemerythrin domain-containing protein [Acidobacteriota bacterium]
MFDWFSSDSDDAIGILKADHDRVKKLFDEFEEAKSLAAKKKIVGETLTELKVHAAVEEDLFYPAVRKKLEKQMMNEADEEHHVAKVLIAELESMKGSEDHYEAKFKVLSENIVHHIKEEEEEMLTAAKALDIDFDDLGRKILAHKRQLLTEGVPTVGEETMVAASHGEGDSPAKAAKKTIKVKPKTKK